MERTTILSDVEKQAVERWSIESNRVCEGGTHPQKCMIFGKSDDLSSGER